MEAEIRPEPDRAEREAILAALSDDAGADSPYSSAWRRAAVEEACGGDGEPAPR